MIGGYESRRCLTLLSSPGVPMLPSPIIPFMQLDAKLLPTFREGQGRQDHAPSLPQGSLQHVAELCNVGAF